MATKRKRRTESAEPPVWLAGVGWVLVLGGAVALAFIVVPRWAATVGSGWSYVAHPAPPHPAGWLNVVLILGPLIGFNLVYFCSPPKLRRRSMAVCSAVFGLEFLTVFVGAVWMVGAGRSGDYLIADKAEQAVTVIGFILLALLAASMIMYWLGGSSTFDAQSDEYFTSGKATVMIQPARQRTRLRALAALVVVWALLLVPVIISARDDHAVGGAHRWPVPYRDNGDFPTAIGGLGSAFAVIWAIVASQTVKAALYRTVWQAKAATSPLHKRRRGGFWLLVWLQYLPASLGAVMWTLVATIAVPQAMEHSGDPDWPDVWTGVVVLSVAPVILLGIQVLVLKAMWRTQDLTGRPRPWRLRQGGIAYQGSF